METAIKNENLKLGRVGVCPVCNGTLRRPLYDFEKYLRDYDKKRAEWYGYDPETDTKKCHNCGPKGMFSGGADGKVNLRADGTPCHHSYESREIGRCYHQYTCKHCGDGYTIDSGD